MRHRLLTTLNSGGALTGTLIEDAFTDTNATALTSHTIAPTNTPAATWRNETGTKQITSNKAITATIDADGESFQSVDAGKSDVTIDVDVTTGTDLANLYGGSILFRVTDQNNLWLVSLRSADNTFKILEKNAGTITARASTSFTYATSTTYAVRVVVSGTSITATINGGNTLTYTSSFNQSATRHGIGEFTASVNARPSYDNFKITG